jgi:hypothetical protein
VEDVMQLQHGDTSDFFNSTRAYITSKSKILEKCSRPAGCPVVAIHTDQIAFQNSESLGKGRNKNSKRWNSTPHQNKF